MEFEKEELLAKLNETTKLDATKKENTSLFYQLKTLECELSQDRAELERISSFKPKEVFSS